MRYIIAEYSNGYANDDLQEYLCFPKTITDAEINNYCLQVIAKHMSCFKPENEDIINYYKHCTFGWYEIDPKDDIEFDENDWTKV